MEKKQQIPEHVFDLFKNKYEIPIYPNIIRTRNITKNGLDLLIDKNKLIWTSTIYDGGVFNYVEGCVGWGANPVLIYFQKLENESTYKLFILTSDLNNISLLLTGLTKFFTIDKI